MNWDMSRRTIAVSSLNRYSASALVSSVLPTPVGPKNMNEPIGRFGSCSPARERRTAVATARTASAWPTTRWPSWSSILRSLSFSPSIVAFLEPDAVLPRQHTAGTDARVEDCRTGGIHALHDTRLARVEQQQRMKIAVAG